VRSLLKFEDHDGFCGQHDAQMLTSTTASLKVCGATVFGAAKVLCALMVEAVRTRPNADFALLPATLQSTAIARLESQFAKERCTTPSLSREADALTAGILFPRKCSQAT